jgi:hypothetical protein
VLSFVRFRRWVDTVTVTGTRPRVMRTNGTRESGGSWIGTRRGRWRAREADLKPG